jgi:hypothetical protein
MAFFFAVTLTALSLLKTVAFSFEARYKTVLSLLESDLGYEMESIFIFSSSVIL